MIISKLCGYYDILKSDDESGIPQEGFSSVGVSYAAIIDKNGNLTDIQELRDGKIKKTMLVPLQKGRAGKNFLPYFLCDKAEYCFGYPSGERFEDFKRLCMEILQQAKCYEAQCFIKYLENWNPLLSAQHPDIQPILEEIQKGQSGLFVFRISGESGYIHENQEIKDSWLNYYVKNYTEGRKGYCLVTGKMAAIAQTHSLIKGVVGANAAGGSLVGCNDSSVNSYGKEQATNSPVGKQTMFKYTAALNWLLNNKSHRIQIGEATTVFWAEMETEDYVDITQELFAPVWSDSKKDTDTMEDVETRRYVHDVLEKIRRGEKPESKDNVRYEANFFILGLTANNARLSVTFWYQGTFGDFIQNVSRHHMDMEVTGGKRVSVSSVLKETFPKQVKSPKITISMNGAYMRAVLSGGGYPDSLFFQIVQRIKIDKEINFRRTGIIKAYLLRKNRIHNIDKEEIKVSLDKESRSIPYRLGRLFAVLEKAQQDASGGSLNSTIKDRYFGTAMSAPSVVFPTLIKLSSHHVKKGEHGGYYESLKSKILDGVDIIGIPRLLSLEQQGEFIMGYYHQERDFYKKKNNNKENTGGNKDE